MRSAHQKNKDPPVESAARPQNLTPTSQAASLLITAPSESSPPSHPTLPPWRQWLSHDDMHLVRKTCLFI